MDGLQGEIPFRWMIWGYPYFRKPPYKKRAPTITGEPGNSDEILALIILCTCPETVGNLNPCVRISGDTGDPVESHAYRISNVRFTVCILRQ